VEVVVVVVDLSKVEVELIIAPTIILMAMRAEEWVDTCMEFTRTRNHLHIHSNNISNISITINPNHSNSAHHTMYIVPVKATVDCRLQEEEEGIWAIDVVVTEEVEERI
jgi:hypothetical protein